MRIDFHVHAFPDHVAPRAMNGLTERALLYSDKTAITPVTDGTIGEARRRLREYGTDAGVLMPIATTVGHQKHVNDWAQEQNHGSIVSFGSVHPKDPEAISELERIRDIGLKGIKLHPDYQGFFADDESVYPIYEKIEELGLPLLFHAGMDPYSPHVVHGKPQAIAKIAKEFPRMIVIAAHLGGSKMYEESMEYIYTQDIPNLYVDTSMTHIYAEPRDIRMAIRMMSTDKVLYASDMPWSNGKKAADALMQLGLRDDELEKIFYKNALRLLQIPEGRIIGGEK
ncbi:MAG: amidohydrolase [Christensenellaceae bacterium]|nr:amidohydrolase [Christensenellaceae bacterium]